MKKSIAYIFYFLWALISSGIISCKKFMEIPPPTSQLETPSVFSSGADATGALTAIYTLMESLTESYNMALNTGMLGDVLTNNSSNTYLVEYYTNSMQANNIN